jgi:Xaa-Pro aminopeptidase
MAEAAHTLSDSVPAQHLALLRGALAQQGLDGFLVPRADEHQGEYVAPCSERLAWLTGFTGSAGLAIVLPDKAALFVDGRYTLQARDQTDTSRFEPVHIADVTPDIWLRGALKPGMRVGYDSWLHTPDGVQRLRQACEHAGATLVPGAANPLDAVWRDRPAPPHAPMVVHDAAYSGETGAAKRARLGRELGDDRLDAAILTLPDSIAWLLNVRGADIPHTPVALCFAILHADTTVDLFVDPAKATDAVRAHLGPDVRVREPAALGQALGDLGAAGKAVGVDPATAPSWIFDRLAEAKARIARGPDPCALPKACKNEVELDGIRAAHVRDGAALTRFLAWVARESAKGGLDEITASDRLEAFRHETGKLQDLSFDTISGAGPNGAIVHYRAEPRTNRVLEPGQLYLVDSGGQYRDGTTDVTRTVAIGTPDSEQRDRFTRVLKGHIALARARFPNGTTGSQLDILAREPLWRAGLDFDHGTGHGVGAYLSVHEGPQRISKAPSTVSLMPGMIVSNEPGYYKTGAFGIRIENLVAVHAADAADGSERPMLCFETLTLAPIDRALVDPDLLAEDEIAWLDAYHARVRDTLSPLVDEATRGWLADVTRPLESTPAAI